MNEQKILSELRDIKMRIMNQEEPINEDEACTFLGIAKQTMRAYVCKGKLDGTFVINKLGKRMFYKSKLIIK